MAITISCGCGKTYTAPDSLAGSKIKCRACQAMLMVPAARAKVAAVPEPAPAPQPAAEPMTAPKSAARARPVVAEIAPRDEPDREVEPTPSAEADADPAAEAEGGEEAPAKFFMAMDSSFLGSSNLYRVYVEREALVMLRVGPAVALLGVEMGRSGRGGHWLGGVADSAKTLVGGGLTILLIIAIILGRLTLRDGGKDIGDAVSMILMFTFVLALAGLAVLWVVRGIVKKAAALDDMTAQQRRGEVKRDKKNRVLTADDLAEASFDKAPGRGGAEGNDPVVLTLVLRPKAKLRLRLEQRKDVKTATKALKRLLGTENVEVNVPVKKGR